MKLIKVLTFAMVSLVSGAVFAAPGQISLKTEAFVETQVTDADGTVRTVREPASAVFPGTEVIYVMSFTNVGTQAADDLVINDPVPSATRYKAGSAFGNSSVSEFSVDGGTEYGRLGRLSVLGDDGKPRPATPSDVTHVRWLVNYTLKPGDTGSVGFRAVVE
jgi:uncharacterized repeat protein (TIGR01451 family)